MKRLILLPLGLAVAAALPATLYGQGTLVFNNLGTNNNLVFVNRGHGGLMIPLDQDLNFDLLAGSEPTNMQRLHAWLLGDGTAKGINVAPGRFADPSDGVYAVPGVAPGAVATVMVRAWGGYYDEYNDNPRQTGSGKTVFTMPTGKPGLPLPGLLWMPELAVSPLPVPVSPLTLGIAWTNGLPQLSIVGRVGNMYALEYLSNLSPPNRWQSLLSQTNWGLTNNPQIFTDSSASGARQRFYRVGPPASPPPPSLVWINPGTFLMGSPTNEADRFIDEGPQTRVTLTYGFWMSQYETTQIEYQAIMGTNPSDFIGDANRPVETVSWNNATNYCARLTDHERLAGRLPLGYAYRLPTEAEWEYAARAGTTTRFSYGDDPGYTNLGAYAWYGTNSSNQTHPVGQKQPNPWGLFDMYGNVEEWCLDWPDGYPGGSVTNTTTGPSLVGFRLTRGGFYRARGGQCRSASRLSGPEAGDVLNIFGFRVVLAPIQP